MNTYYCGDPRTKSQPQDTKHKGLKLLTFVTCQFLMVRISRYFKMMKAQVISFLNVCLELPDIQQEEASLAQSIETVSFCIKICFKMCLGYINRNQWKYG